MSVVEYTHWIDKMMGFTTVDATRTTNLPMCDEGPALGAMQDLLERHGQNKRKRAAATLLTTRLRMNPQNRSTQC